MAAGDGHVVTSRFGVGQRLLCFAQLAMTIDHIVERWTIVDGHLLGHVRDAPVTRQLDVATVWLQAAPAGRTQDQIKKGGFADAVAADESYLLTGMYGQAHVVEKRYLVALQADVNDLEQGCASSVSASSADGESADEKACNQHDEAPDQNDRSLHNPWSHNR